MLDHRQKFGEIILFTNDRSDQLLLSSIILLHKDDQIVMRTDCYMISWREGLIHPEK